MMNPRFNYDAIHMDEGESYFDPKLFTELVYLLLKSKDVIIF